MRARIAGRMTSFTDGVVDLDAQRCACGAAKPGERTGATYHGLHKCWRETAQCDRALYGEDCGYCDPEGGE